MPYKLKISEADVLGKAKFVSEAQKTECVAFVQQATEAPHTSLWVRGQLVKSFKPGELERGTAIATFDDNGKYPKGDNGKHAAIYLSHSLVKDTIIGMVVLDQWNSQGEVKQRTIRFNRDAKTYVSNNGDAFYVIN